MTNFIIEYRVTGLQVSVNMSVCREQNNKAYSMDIRINGFLHILCKSIIFYIYIYTSSAPWVFTILFFYIGKKVNVQRWSLHFVSGTQTSPNKEQQDKVKLCQSSLRITGCRNDHCEFQIASYIHPNGLD